MYDSNVTFYVSNLGSFTFKMGNNLLTTAGAIALAKVINESDSSEMEELDLTVGGQDSNIDNIYVKCSYALIKST